MLRIFLSPALAALFLTAPTFAPSSIGHSAQAVTKRLVSPKAGAARATTVKSSKSNTSDRMGGGGGHTLRATTVKSSKSNTSDRIGAPGPFGLGR